MQSPITRQKITCKNLPLGVYREVVAHLRQVESIDASLILRSIDHDELEKFDYYQSQVSALQISYGENADETVKEKVAAILDYYAQRYNPWETI